MHLQLSRTFLFDHFHHFQSADIKGLQGFVSQKMVMSAFINNF